MNALAIHRRLIDGYSGYIGSFIEIKDADIRGEVLSQIARGVLWPPPLVQFNPAYATAPSVQALVSSGLLAPQLGDLFHGYDLYAHQVEALKLGVQGADFVVTSGTGSGKSLTYLGSIFHSLFSGPLPDEGVQAVVVYPMNALINSQMKELTKHAERWQKRTGAEFPVRFAQYTGQTKEDEKQRIRERPPHIVLTNYMMLELMLTRATEYPLRTAIAGHLRFLAFDELHTYRGRQGSDVGMLIRRLRALRGAPVTCIGTSATMVSSGTVQEQRQRVAEVASRIFGKQFTPDQVIPETLRRSLDSEKLPTATELAAAIRSPVPSHEREEMTIKRHPVMRWLESAIALRQEGERLLRGKPRSLEEMASALAEASHEPEQGCLDHLHQLLPWLSEVNGALVRSGKGNTILPFRLHQFFSQTGSVYVTLGHPGDRKVTLTAGLYAGDGSDLLLFPHVFSRASGHTFICVWRNDQRSCLEPREFNATDLRDGCVAGYIIPGGDEVWNPTDDLDSVPDSWMNIRKDGARNWKKDFAGRAPLQVRYNSQGAFGLRPAEDLPLEGWFMAESLLFDPTAGLFFDPNTAERTKLTTLGNEGRSTATTITAFLALHGMDDEGFGLKEQKLLSFTDNRQDAALQAGHFNDFVRVVRIRCALARAVTEAPEQTLDFSSLRGAMVKALKMEFAEYAQHESPNPFPAVREQFEKALQLSLFYHAIHDLRRGWRVVLPNLERCGLLRVRFVHLPEIAGDARLDGLPYLGGLPASQREQFLDAVLQHFRLEYAIHNEEFLEPASVDQHRSDLRAKLRPSWILDENTNLRPRALSLGKAHRTVKQEVRGLGLTSALGKYIKAFVKEHAEINLGRQDYDVFIREVLGVLEDAGYLAQVSVAGAGGGQIQAYRVHLHQIRWTPGDGIHAVKDAVKERAFKTYKPKANTFFQGVYTDDYSRRKPLRANDHTGQLNNEDRQEREEQFRADYYLADKVTPDQAAIRRNSLSLLVCSPTMELGIDISDLSLVHMRNVPPNPSNYAQRSGRAGRSGQAALVMTYCSSYSPHDRHYFRQQEKLVAGAVEPPRLDLLNPTLLESHLHALFLSEIGIPSMTLSAFDVLEEVLPDLPLKPLVAKQLQLSEGQLGQVIARFRAAIRDQEPDLLRQPWFNDDWARKCLRALPRTFDQAFNRWRILYRLAGRSLQEASACIQSQLYTTQSREFRDAQSRERQANTQLDLLRNRPTPGRSNEMSEFYVFRYLAAEGFLPGYNFTRLPIRLFLEQRDGGEFISRPRFLALGEFGPKNIIYHNGSKYHVQQQTQLEITLKKAAAINASGYWLDEGEEGVVACPLTKAPAVSNSDKSEFVELLDLAESRATIREYITCEEEERRRLGFDIKTYFTVPGGDMSRLRKANLRSGGDPLLHLTYIPAARLIYVNHKARNTGEDGFCIGLKTGLWKSAGEVQELLDNPNPDAEPIARVKPFTTDTADALYLQPLQALGLDRAGVLTLQYALKRAIENLYQVEPAEIGADPMGREDAPNVLLYEAAEGSLGILSRLVDEQHQFAEVVTEAYRLLHYEDGDRGKKASYDDLLSYYNQPHHLLLDRWLIEPALKRLLACQVQIPGAAYASYEEQYASLSATRDQSSEMEQKFLDYLYERKLRLPDKAQPDVPGIYCRPDFYYTEDTYVFCDGTPHDDPAVGADDEAKRRALRDRGSEVIEWHYRDSLEALVVRYPDIFRRRS